MDRNVICIKWGTKFGPEYVNKLYKMVEKNLSLDLIALDIKNVWLKLGEITGETNTEEIIDEIFMKFCLGK